MSKFGDKQYFSLLLKKEGYSDKQSSEIIDIFIKGMQDKLLEDGSLEKRKAILEDLAAKISKTVLRTGRTSTLEPMNPYERRIIHSKVSEIEGVTSKSIGEEPYRRVVISSTNPRPQRTDGAPRTYNGNRRDGDKNSYNNNRRGNNKEGGYGRRNGKRDEEFTPRSLDMMKTSFEKEYKKPKPEDELVKGSLYGKIDI